MFARQLVELTGDPAIVRGTYRLLPGGEARTYADAPEIDGQVIVPGAWDLEPGDFIEVEITRSGPHDLLGMPVE